MTEIKITTGDLWDSGLEDDLIKPLAERALKKFGDFVVQNKKEDNMNLLWTGIKSE